MTEARSVAAIVLCGGSLHVANPAALLGEYLDRTYGYAFPAYDTLVTNGTPELVTGDLLAPALLDAPVDRSRFEALRDMWPQLAGVGSLPPRSLAAATDDDVAAVARLFAGLDAPRYRRAGVRGTVVSKVLHRKRPDLVPLVDSRVETAYRASGHIARDPDRTWQEFMTTLCRLMREDLLANADGLAALGAMAAEQSVRLTELRIVDILIWMSLRD